MIKYLAASVLSLLVGCSAPQNKFSSVEALRDSRNFSNVNVYGKCESDIGNVFGQIEIKSNPKTGADDFTNFNSRMRLVKQLYNGVGMTAEYRDFSGDKNSVAGAGFSYSINNLEFRVYPFRTNETQEAGISSGKVFEMGSLDPYIRGSVDIDKKEGGFYSVGKLQIGLKAENGWRIVTEIRYSDLDRANGMRGFGGDFGFGMDF